MGSIEALADGLAGLTERALGPQDAAAAVLLSEEAGWNQVAADWRLMLAAGRGLGMQDHAGRLVGTALTLPLGPRLSWISMVLTLKAWRHRGIGTHLLRRCIVLVRDAEATAGLDATEIGRPIYAALGFVDLYRLSRWHLPRAIPPSAPRRGATVRLATPVDIAAIAAYDAPRSALDRVAILAHLLGRAPALAHVAESDGRLCGYAMARDGRIATQVGPVVADDDGIAQALVGRATRAGAPPFFLDVPDRHAALAAALREAGATAPRGFFRMALGAAPGLDDARHVFALAGPELA